MKTNNTFFTRFVLVLFGLIVTMTCFAGGKKEQRLIEEAIQRGTTQAGTYVIQASPKDRVKVRDMRWYMEKEHKDYMYLGAQEYSNGYLDKCWFLIPEDVHGISSRYLFAAYLMLDGKINVNDLKNAGTIGAYYPIVKNFNLVYFANKKRTILWLGDVVDGMIHGTGYGIWLMRYVNSKSDNPGIYCVEGTFDHGIPVADYVETHIDSYFYNGPTSIGAVRKTKYQRPTIDLLERGRDAESKGERVYPEGSPDYNRFDMAILTYNGRPDDVIDEYIVNAQNTLKGKLPLYLSQYVWGIRESDEEASNLRRTITKIHNEQPSEKTQLCLDYMLLLDGLCLATTSDTTLAQRSKTIERNDSQYYEVLENSKALAERFGEEDSEIGHICKEKAKIIDGWIARIKERAKFNADYEKRLEANKTYTYTPYKDDEDIMKMIVSKSAWTDEDKSGILEQKVKFSDGKEVKIYYSPKRSQEEKACYGVLGPLGLEMYWYYTYEEAVVSAYR